jgi:hypothetical protein
MPDLEERVAALEARVAPGPLLKPFGLPPLTEEQEAELRRAFDETMRPLTPVQIRQLLSECVTVVRPGETLVVRVPWTTTPSQLREYQRVTDSAEGGVIPFRVLVVAGDELGVVQPEPDPAVLRPRVRA